jgi:predicted butyrate kinase (DUF1464 family)
LRVENEEKMSDDEESEMMQNMGNGVLRNIWIVKPGENTNRGKGIYVCGSLPEIKSLVNQSKVRSVCQRTVIV